MTSYILVPLDGSSLAEAALPSATALARATASTLILLRVVPPLTMIEPMGGAVYPGDAFWDAYEHEPEVAREYVSKVAANLRHDGIAVQTRVAYGEPAACILEHISAFPTINYVAMGTHGRSGLGRIFFGSVAEKVLRLSTVPVLLVRSGRDVAMQAEMEQAKRTFKHILVPLDGSELAEHGIQQARRLALDTDADITLLAVVPNPSV